MKDRASKAISEAYHRRCSGVQIDIMDVGRVMAEGRRALDAGEDMEAAIVAFVETIRKN